ncbi:MAG TPA: amidohydrolase family protein [Candidatus Nanopelagicales bacterium]
MPAFTKDADWLDWDPSPTKPAYVPPAGAVDAHCHVFGPGDEFPFAPERKYTPCDASKDQLWALRDFLGFDRNVVVQATCHGADNGAMVDALRHSGGRARGVATIRPSVTEGELRDMHDAGVRGVRFNFVKRLVDPKPDAYYRALVERIAPLGWHVVVYFEAPDLAERWNLFTSFGVPVVVDHMGRPEVGKAVDGEDFGQFLRFMDSSADVWSKVSCPERLSVAGPPTYSDVHPFARTIVHRYSDRVLWGTDWPHPNMTSHMPDDGLLVDVIPHIAPTEELQQALLVDNPTRLYWEA